MLRSYKTLKTSFEISKIPKITFFDYVSIIRNESESSNTNISISRKILLE